MKVTSKVNVACMLDTAQKEMQKTRKRMLLKQLSTLRCILRQGLAVRGHSEIESNLQQVLKLRAEYDGELSTWLSEGKYLSLTIINEQIELMANYLLRHMLSEIRLSPWFAIVVDEATDITYNEQLCIVIRWLNENYEIFEEPLGLIQVPKTDSVTLTDAIKDVLIRCMLSLNQCRGQAYDGAANMSGHLNGVVARIKSSHPSVLHVHCLAHCLNLCLQDVARICTPIRDVLELIRELVKLIKFSPKRAHLFQTLKSQMSPETSDLRPLCPTRWTVRTCSIKVLLENYSTLCTVLEEIHTTGHDEYAMKAGGFLNQLEKFSTFFSLKLSFMVFGPAEQLSNTLQGKDINVQQAKQSALLTEAFLRRQRTESAFDHFYDCIVREANNLTDEPVLPRKRKAPKRMDDGAEPHAFDTPRDYHKQLYFEMLDVVCNEISRRFNQKDLNVVIDMEKLLLAAGNGEEIALPDTIRIKYGGDLHMDRLFTHLKMFPDIVRRFSEQTGSTVKRVTSVSTLSQIMNDTPGAKVLCTELHRLIQLFLTIPVTTSTSERTFSTLRRVKNHLRSSMTQERLNHVLLLHCLKSRTDDINLHCIASDFISVNDRRKKFFGNNV